MVNKELEKAIEAMVEEWHTNPMLKHIELHDYLAMSEEQYGLWAFKPSEWERKYASSYFSAEQINEVLGL